MNARMDVQNWGQPKPELRKIDTIKTQVRREFFIDVTKVVFRNKRSTSPFLTARKLGFSNHKI